MYWQGTKVKSLRTRLSRQATAMILTVLNQSCSGNSEPRHLRGGGQKEKFKK